MTNPFNLKPNLCTPCGGMCCKTLPGSASPSDFPTEELRSEALSSGRWCIDWWEGDPREGKDEVDTAQYMRPATKGKEGKLFDPSWGGECTFLTEKGCELTPDKRPAQCRAVVPHPNNDDCKVDNENFTRQAIAISWLGILNN